MYQVKLYYGYEEHECGTFHSFRAEDPNAEVDLDEISKDLAEQLDRDVNDDCFHWNMLFVNLPDEVVAKIKADGVKEHLADRAAALSAIKGTETINPNNDATSVTVYKDTLGYYDEEDNLAEILVPRQWLEDTLRIEGQPPYEQWENEYTADDTEGIAAKALSDRVIQGCTGIDLLADGAKVEWAHTLYEVVGIKDGLVYLQHVNNDMHAEIPIERFLKDAELVPEDQISKSSLDGKIAAATAIRCVNPGVKAEPAPGFDRD